MRTVKYNVVDIYYRMGCSRNSLRQQINNIYTLMWTGLKNIVSSDKLRYGNKSTAQSNIHRGSTHESRLQFTDSGARTVSGYNFLLAA